MGIKVGERVRLLQDFGYRWPAGLTGVVTKSDPSGAVEVAFDNGDTTWCSDDTLEVYVPQFASHYQAQPIMEDGQYDRTLDKPWAGDEPASAPDTPLSGEELMNITRSFCR